MVSNIPIANVDTITEEESGRTITREIGNEKQVTLAQLRVNNISRQPLDRLQRM